MFTAHQEYATLVLHSNVRLVSNSMVAMIVGSISEDFRSRSLGLNVFDILFQKANQDKTLKAHEECIAAMRHVQWLPCQNEIGDESCA